MNRKQNLTTRQQELSRIRVEYEAMKKREEELKKEFRASPENSLERAKIKKELTALQEEKFEKGELGKSIKFCIRDDENFQRFSNLTGPATDPSHLAKLIKAELKAVLDGSRKMESGDTIGDILEANQSKDFCYFGQSKEIKEAIANLARNRQKPVDPDKIVSRTVRVKTGDLSTADFSQIISLIRQVRSFLEEKNKQEEQRIENIKLNNSHLFTQWKCSTEKRNGVRKWENWHTFSGKHNGFDYTIYIPDHHIALTNCLFDNGWGRNSEVGKFFVVEGVAAPTTLRYWNVKKRKSEIISEEEAKHLIRQDKDNYKHLISYSSYVEVDEKITVRHYDEKKDKLDLTGKGQWSGINPYYDGSKKNEGLISSKRNKSDKEVNFLEIFFNKYNVKQVSLTSEGELTIEYNDNHQNANNSQIQEVKKSLSRIGRTSLNFSQLQEIKAKNSNGDNLHSPKIINKLLIGGGIAIVVAGVLGYCWYLGKSHSKKSKK